MSLPNLKKICLKINGMHCASCEVLIERKLKQFPGIERVNVNHVQGKAEIFYSSFPGTVALNNLLQNLGYTVNLWQEGKETAQPASSKNTSKDYAEMGTVFMILVALYLLLKQFNILPQNFGISDNMNFGFVFLIGLVAAMSTCIAVTGGLLVAVAAKYNEQYPHLNGVQKFRPHLYFNIGRVVSYTVLGGLVGALGSVISLSPRVNGMLTVFVSFIMIILGFQLLRLFPGLRRFQPKMPKFLAHKIHDLTGQDRKSTPFFLGASTFFLPCGFTQALQLYVLSKGDSLTGALTMLAFSLGTLPALLSLSALSSFVKGSFQRYFLKFAGILVIVLGFSNINNGLNLAGIRFSSASLFDIGQTTASQDNLVKIVNGVQIVEMKVNGYEYSPSNFTIVKNVPVEWRIDGSGAKGCGQVIVAPNLDISEYLPKKGIKTIRFTPKETGEIPFNCSMGMMTPGASFTVIENASNITDNSSRSISTNSDNSVNALVEADALNTGRTDGCDPSIESCPIQKFFMEVSNERGFYPNTFEAKKGIPIELEIDDKVALGGCMGTVVVPDYDVAKRLTLGKNTLSFTPTKEGNSLLTCSMGNPLGEFIIR
ncbi:sulfite exporter TauE/SafE family protein [Candidatus Peregrinibacteria bacterium]|nr:sulfite exporter TauE/SafE family protein [Candidatus Peregrinibacteria bacterium]